MNANKGQSRQCIETTWLQLPGVIQRVIGLDGLNHMA